MPDHRNRFSPRPPDGMPTSASAARLADLACLRFVLPLPARLAQRAALNESSRIADLAARAAFRMVPHG